MPIPEKCSYNQVMRRLLEYSRSNSRYLRASVLTSALVLSLTACTGVHGGVTTSSTDTTSVPSSSELSTPTATADLAAKSYPVGKTCKDVMSLQALYDFNPNFAYDASLSPSNASHAENILSIEGISCVYLNLSSGSKIVLSLAKLDEMGLSTIKEKLSTEGAKKATSFSPPVDASFFSITDGVGTLDILTNGYWVSVSSSSFIYPEDAAHFLETVLASLS